MNIYNGRQEPYGLERIEFLKGASSVLYGAMPPGGVINTVSKRPTVEPLRELNVEAGSFRRRQVSADFGGALDQDGTWSYRLTALRRDSDTFVDYVPDDRTYVAPAIKWQPNEATSLTLLAEYQQDRTVYVYGLPAQGTVLPNPNGRIPRNRFTGEPGLDEFKMKRYSVGYLFEHAFTSQLKLRHNLRYINAKSDYGSTDLWQLMPDGRRTADRGFSPRVDRSSAVSTDTSLQYQTRTGIVEHTLLAGLDYSTPKHETRRYFQTLDNLDLYDPVYGSPLGPVTPNINSSTKSDTKRLGIYLQDQMKIADKWVVLLGGRQDWVRANEHNLFTGEQYAQDEKTKAFTGRAGLVYLADNGLAPFLSYSQSFEPTTGQDRQGSRFKPTEGEQYEAGLRYQPAGSDTMLSAAVYQLTRKNLTVPDPMDTSYQIQAGKARSRGLELEARTRIGRNANLIAAYAYTDARTLKASPLQPDAEGRRLDSVPFNQFSIWGLRVRRFRPAGPARRRRPALCGQHTRHGAWHGGRGAVLHAARRHGQLHHGTVALRAERHQPGRQDLHRQLHLRLLLRRTPPHHRHRHLSLVAHTTAPQRRGRVRRRAARFHRGPPQAIDQARAVHIALRAQVAFVIAAPEAAVGFRDAINQVQAEQQRRLAAGAVRHPFAVLAGVAGRGGLDPRVIAQRLQHGLGRIAQVPACADADAEGGGSALDRRAVVREHGLIDRRAGAGGAGAVGGFFAMELEQPAKASVAARMAQRHGMERCWKRIDLSL